VLLVGLLCLGVEVREAIADSDDDTGGGVCLKDSCGDINDDIEWEEEHVGKQIISWIAQQRSRNKVVFCKEEVEKKALGKEALPLYKIGLCSEMRHHSKHQFVGSRDAENRFKGKGDLMFLTEDLSLEKHRESNRLAIESGSGICVVDNAFMSMKSVKGYFKAGFPKGNIKITLKNFGEISGHGIEGVLHGKVVIKNKKEGLVFVGRYLDGRPHGWAWLFCPDDGDQSTGAVYLQFNNGEIVDQKIVFVLPGFEEAVVGTYSEETGMLENGHKFQISSYGDKGCIRHIKIPEVDKPGKKKVSLPMQFKVVEGRVAVTSSRVLLFNRVAKVGSQSLIRLMVELSQTRGYHVSVDQRTVEQYNSPPWEQLQLAETLTSFTMPTVWVRHYNFLDFDSFGLASPKWVNLVRDPVERVISNFYYRRAGWNIVEQKLAFPEEPLPDPAFLRRDFESCVLDGDPECTYIDDSTDTEKETGDHRRQMMQYCGQHPVCAQFNNKEAMEMAKVREKYTYINHFTN